MTEAELRALAAWLQRMALNPGDQYDQAAIALSTLSKEKAELEKQLAEYEAVIVSSRLKQDIGYDRGYLRTIQQRAAERHASRQSGG